MRRRKPARHAQRQREQQSQCAQSQRDRQPLGHQLGDGEIAIDQTWPEIALCQISDIAGELHGQRLIHAIGSDQRRARGGIKRALAIKWAAGGEAHQQEG
jgi:hypothetical protein